MDLGLGDVTGFAVHQSIHGAPEEQVVGEVVSDGFEFSFHPLFFR